MKTTATRPAALIVLLCLTTAVAATNAGDESAKLNFDIRQIDHDREIKAADAMLNDRPITVTAAHCPRSAGGLHDFFSEADYAWPDPAHPDGPYINKDGQTNPDNFVEHRQALMRLTHHVGTFTSAWRITNERTYADAAIRHLRAWFVDENTRMNPNLQFAQAIKGKATGRPTGIIDTIHLVEVARSAKLLADAGLLAGEDLTATRKWFADYLKWLCTSRNGLQEMKAANNHGTWSIAQIAVYASFTGDESRLAMCRKRFKEVLLPHQMAADGSFPEELRRTKPYNYSILNIDGFTLIAWVCSTPDDNLWEFKLDDGRSLRKGIEFIYPYIKDRSTWPYPPDVMNWEYPLSRWPALFFGGLAYHQQAWLDTWKSLEADPTVDPMVRSLPTRHPILWVD